MKNKLAMWSWILPIIGYGSYIFLTIVLHALLVVNRNLEIVLLILLLIGSTMTGFIFGIIGLNSKMSGRAHAMVGIILNVLLFIYGLFALWAGLIGG